LTPADATPQGPPERRRRRWSRLIGLMFAALLAAVAGTAWLAADPERLRLVVEQSVSRLSGKAFSIEGSFDYELGRVVTVHAADIHWRDGRGEAAPLLQIGQASAAIDLWSLIVRPIRIIDVQVRDATLRFDWSDDRFNWRTGADEPAVAGGPVPLVIERASLENVDLKFRHPHLTDDVLVQVLNARHQADAANRVALTGSLRLDDRELTLDGSIGPLPELLAGGTVDMEASLTGPLGSLAARGATTALAGLADLQLDAKLHAPDAAELAQRLKLPLATTGAAELSARIDTRGERAEFHGDGFFGEYRIDAQFQTDRLVSLDGLEALVHLSGPSARGLAALLGHGALPNTPFELEFRAKRSEAGLELQRLTFDAQGLRAEASGIARAADAMRDIDLDLNVEGENVGDLAALVDWAIDAPMPFKLHTTIAGQGPNQDDDVDAQLQLGDISVGLRGTLSETDDLRGSRLRFDLDAPDASDLDALVGFPMPTKKRLQLGGQLAFDGRHALIEGLDARLAGTTLTGRMRLKPGDERPTVAFNGEARGSDLGAVIGHLLPPTVLRHLPDGHFSAMSKLTFSDRTLDIDASSLQLGETRFGFQGQLDTKGAGPNLAGDVSVTGKHLADWLDGRKIVALRNAFRIDGKVRFSPQSLRLDRLTAVLGENRLSGTIDLSGKDLNEVRFDLHGRSKDLSILLPEHPDYRPAPLPVDLVLRGRRNATTLELEQLQASVGDIRLNSTGVVQYQPGWEARDLKIEAKGARLSDLGTFGHYTPPERPFTLKATIVGDTRTQRVADLRFESGGDALSGHLSWVMADRPRFEVDLTSSRLTLDHFADPGSIIGDAVSGNVAPDRIFGDEPLPFELLDRFDATVHLRIEKLLSHHRLWRNVVVDADVDRGVLQLRQGSIDATAGKVTLSGTLRPNGTGRALALQINASDAILTSESMTPEEIQRLPRHAIDARLSASGNTPHELATSLNGYIWIVGGEGYGHRSSIAPLYGSLGLELLSAINPASAKNPEVRIDCDGIYLEVEQGKIETAPSLVLQTERIIVLAAGEIDLHTEKLDITFETTPLRGLGVGFGDVLNPLTKLSGTLRNPKIVPDPAGTLIGGGAAVATSGLSILAKGLFKRWFGSHQVCERIGEQALEIRRKKDPKNLPDLEALIAATKPDATAKAQAARKTGP